jgi:hypothetical protein
MEGRNLSEPDYQNVAYITNVRIVGVEHFQPLPIMVAMERGFAETHYVAANAKKSRNGAG